MCSFGSYIKFIAKKQLREVSEKHAAHKKWARLVGMSCDILSAVSVEFLLMLVAGWQFMVPVAGWQFMAPSWQSRERSTVPSWQFMEQRRKARQWSCPHLSPVPRPPTRTLTFASAASGRGITTWKVAASSACRGSRDCRGSDACRGPRDCRASSAYAASSDCLGSSSFRRPGDSRSFSFLREPGEFIH